MNTTQCYHCASGDMLPAHLTKCPACKLPLGPPPPPAALPPPPTRSVPAITYEPPPVRGEWEGVSLKERIDILTTSPQFAGSTRALMAKYFREVTGI